MYFSFAVLVTFFAFFFCMYLVVLVSFSCFCKFFSFSFFSFCVISQFFCFGEGEGSVVSNFVIFVYLYFAMAEIKSHYYKKTKKKKVQ